MLRLELIGDSRNRMELGFDSEHSNFILRMRQTIAMHGQTQKMRGSLMLKQ